MDTTAYQEFAKEKLGFEFNDINLLVTALTHRSYVNEHKKVHEHNERLEFLGDAVLELVSSDFLFREYNYPEGVKGEKHGSERAHDVILADCFEAVIGAIYLDQGYEAAREFITKHILVKIDAILDEGSWRDPKSYVQELAQKYDGITPTYKTLREDGPDHDKTFTVGLYVGDAIKGLGKGHSKQEAQTNAAREGVKLYQKLRK